MNGSGILVGLAVGIAQGVLEWLPVSSEGNVALLLSALGRTPERVVAFALFVHLGTALSATVYYRGELRELAAVTPRWRPSRAFDEELASVTFLAVGTLVSGVVGLAAYASLTGLFTASAGGGLLAAIGGLLVLTGAFQYAVRDVGGGRATPDGVDAVAVGVAQGLAILPGVSRSGVTAGTLLLRGHEPNRAFRLSFLLAIPASVGGGLLAYVDTGIGIGALAAAVALGAAAATGYATIGALLRTADRLPFWGVCVGLGALSLTGALLAA